MTIRALIFDFDGLILETEEPVFLSWQELYREHGCQLSFDDWATIIGTMDADFDPLKSLEDCIGRSLPDNRAQRRLQRETELILERPALPGVEKYLKDAQRLGLRIGLASSSPCSWVTNHLTRLRLIDYFQAIRGRDDVKLTKPDPELYLAAAEGLGVPTEEAIALEDSPNGITAAKRAGMYCVAVPNVLTRRLPLEQADLRLDSLIDLPLEELIKKIEAQLSQTVQ